jgi:peptide/nickel transport system permease protein
MKHSEMPPVRGENTNREEERYFSQKVESVSRLVWKRFRRHRLAMFGAVVIAVVLIFIVFAPYIAPYPPEELHTEMVQNGKPIPPSRQFIFGTDNLGRDYFTRCIYGGRTSLMVGFGGVLLSLLIGVPLGCIAGFYGGAADMLICRFIDMLNCIPTFFLLMIANALLKPGVFTVTVILGVFGWTGIARQLRAQFLSLREQEFVQAASALGLRDSGITFRHLLPNALMPVVVSATMGIAGNIMAESGLSYLGLGVQEPFASWGSMLRISQTYIRSASWMMIFPGILISLVALSLNFMGDGLRDALDPRTVK